MATDYQIVSDFVLRDRTKDGVTAINRSIMGLERNVHRLSNRFSGLFAGALGAAGLGIMLNRIVNINKELQDAQYGIAGLFTALTKIPMEDTLKGSVGLIGILRKQAAAGVGDLSTYLTGFQTVLAPLLNAGMGLDEILKINRQAIAAGAAVTPENPEYGSKLATRDITQALYRGVNPNQTQFAIMALQSMGITNEKFNDMNIKDRAKTLGQAFESFEPLAAAYGQTFTAQFDTLKDNIKQISQIGTNGLFKIWVEDIKKVNEWIAKNKQLIFDIAVTIGDKMEKTYGYVKNHWRDIARYALLVAGAKVALGIPSGGLGNVISNGLQRSASATKLVGGYTNGQFGVNRVPTLGGRILSGLGMGGAGASVAGSILGTAGILAIVGVAFLGLYNAIKTIPGVLTPLYNGLFRIGSAFKNVFDSVLNLTKGESGNSLAVLGQGLIEFGTTILNVTAIVIDGVSRLISFSQKAYEWFGQFNVGKRFDTALTDSRTGGSFAKSVLFETLGQAKEIATLPVSIWRWAGSGIDKAAGGMLGDAPQGFTLKKWIEDTNSFDELKKKIDEWKKNGIGSNITNIDTVNVEVKAEINEDPNRIASSFNEVLRNLDKYRTQALAY